MKRTFTKSLALCLAAGLSAQAKEIQFGGYTWKASATMMPAGPRM